MTREEAIKILKECREKGFKRTFYSESQYHEALDMAIKALESQSEDCISRKDAKKIIFDEFEGWPTDEEVAQLKRLIKQLDELPSVTPMQRWIPVSERLPDLWDERYLVSLAWGGVGVMEYKSTGFHNYGSFSPVPIETVTAWMQLPEPYKAESEESDADSD